MSCKHFAAALLIGLVLAGPAWSFAPTSMSDYEVYLPAAQVSPIHTNPGEAEAAVLLPTLATFRSGEGQGWKVLEWDPNLGTPSSMGGPPIPLVGPGASEDAIRAGIEAFVARNAAAFRANPQQLRITSVTDLGGERSYVIMGQFIDGIEVIDGRLDFGLWKGNIVLVGSALYQNVDVSLLATVDESSAIALAHNGIPVSDGDGVTHPSRLVVLPVFSGTTPVYHLAWEVYLKTNAPENIWRTYVDAHDGTLLWRQGEYAFYEITGTTRGQVEPKSVYTPPQYVNSPLEDERVTASGSYTGYSDETGAFSVTVPNNTTYSLNTQFYGYWCNVNNQSGGDASLTRDGSPTNPVNFFFDDTNSHPAERDVYYHVNDTHDWIKSIDPTFTYLDLVMAANVNIPSTCNAYYVNRTVNFYLEGGGCNNTGRIADVISHEYGHGITAGEYSPNSPPTGSGMGEGFSDIYAMTMHGDPVMGENFNTNGAPVRDGENLRQYPGTECAGEVHCLGEIIMGAMWKTRKNFVEKYGQPGVSTYDHLTINTVKTKTTNMPGFLNRLLMNDDTDGNLANGTPNWYEICNAFAIHNLPCPPLTSYVTISSNPIDDQTVSGDYMITAIAQAVGGGALDPSKIKIYYTTDVPGGPTTWLSVTMSATGNPDEYQGAIPNQGCGQHVRYYVKAEKFTGESATAPALAPYHAVYEFMTGQFDAFADDLEQDRGWTVHPADDTASTGFFERADPVGKSSTTYGVTQPEDDHTPTGTQCFVTDSRGGAWSSYDVDGGRVSVVSPRFDWSNNPVAEIRFWGFYFDVTPTDDTLRVAISTDDGTTWKDIRKIIGSDLNAWTFYKVYAEDAKYGFTSTMRVRFQMEDLNVQTTCAEACIDDIEIRYTVCTSDVANGSDLPAKFLVEQNRPNPFNPLTTIKFGLPAASHASVEIYDASGRKVRTLFDGMKPAGYHNVVWDGRDDANRAVGSGVYYYSVKAGDKQASHKMMLLK